MDETKTAKSAGTMRGYSLEHPPPTCGGLSAGANKRTRHSTPRVLSFRAKGKGKEHCGATNIPGLAENTSTTTISDVRLLLRLFSLMDEAEREQFLMVGDTLATASKRKRQAMDDL